MAQKLTVADVIKEMSATKKNNGKFNYHRFNKKSFNKLLKTMINDPDFKTEVASVKKGQMTIEEIEVSKEFRNFCKKIVEKAGVDKAESAKVLTADFTIDNVDGIYDLFATAMYEYIAAGNKFDFIPKKDFKGSILLKEMPKTTKTSVAHSPKTREELGTFETTMKAHKVLSVKSSCPSYLKSRKKLK